MKIVTVPNSILTAKAKTVISFDKKLEKLVKDMKVALASQTDPEGVGLAAPQVGVGWRLFIMKPTPKAKLTVCINPEIISNLKSPSSNISKKKKESKGTKLEGCLSIPKMWGHVDRDPQVMLRYQTLTGEVVENMFVRFEALIVQHEMDHLDGTLFTKRILEQNGILYKEEAGELKEYEIGG